MQLVVLFTASFPGTICTSQRDAEEASGPVSKLRASPEPVNTAVSWEEPKQSGRCRNQALNTVPFHKDSIIVENTSVCYIEWRWTAPPTSLVHLTEKLSCQWSAECKTEHPTGGTVPQRPDPDLTASRITQTISLKLAGKNLSPCESNSNAPFSLDRLNIIRLKENKIKWN